MAWCHVAISALPNLRAKSPELSASWLCWVSSSVSLSNFWPAAAHVMPFCCALAIECHQRRSDLPLRQVDFMYRRLEPRPAVHFALEFSREKTASKCELGSNNTLLRVKSKQSLQFLLFCLVCKGILHLGLVGFFVFVISKPALSRRTLLWTGFPANGNGIFISCALVGKAQESALQHVALPSACPPHSWPWEVALALLSSQHSGKYQAQCLTPS